MYEKPLRNDTAQTSCRAETRKTVRALKIGGVPCEKGLRQMVDPNRPGRHTRLGGT